MASQTVDKIREAEKKASDDLTAADAEAVRIIGQAKDAAAHELTRRINEAGDYAARLAEKTSLEAEKIMEQARADAQKQTAQLRENAAPMSSAAKSAVISQIIPG